MKPRLAFLMLWLSVAVSVVGQPHFSLPHGLYDQESLSVVITPTDAGATVCYTTDGSLPTTGSIVYTGPLVISSSTVIRAVEVKDGAVVSPVATATYLLTASVLSQSNTPAGYPSTWGEYTTIWGTAPADYEMDPEMTGDPVLRSKIVQGLHDLPILSIVTDRDCLFSHENDPDRGGIYIFTGPPTGDNTGHGWTRPASVELFGRATTGQGGGAYDLTVSCGLRLHGGHGRLAEKNPKHSFRLVFKEQYGPKTLQYPLFDPQPSTLNPSPSTFNQLVLRCHFGNSWQHWAEGNRQKAQYTRDVWARRMQRRMGHVSVNALYVHLFLNGMYWGLYNIAERVDDLFCKTYLGGKKSEQDVIKIEEDGGNHIEAAEGTLDAWQLMVRTARQAADDTYYYMLQGKDAEGNDDPDMEVLLDVDGFIDYMLINQYGGNTDWAHHNWYAVRRQGPESQGFRFLCWDSEIIFENVKENVLAKDNGSESPTGIFQNLLHNDDFARRYVRRAREVLADDGLLGPASIVEVWDSLYNTIASALYCEAARWGDYRRDVHPWQTRGQLYTVDDTYMAERQRLLTQYFPTRSSYVLNSILNYVDIDDFEMPDGWLPLTATMFREWNGTGANAQPVDKDVNVSWNFRQNVGGGGAVAGFVNVDHNQFANLTNYDYLVLRGTGSGLRILANRLVAHGPYKQIVVDFNEWSPYWNDELQAIVFPLAELRTTPTNEGKARNDGFVHLHVLKVDWNSSCNVKAAYLIPNQQSDGIMAIDRSTQRPGMDYNLNGQPITTPRHGSIIIRNGRKEMVRNR